MKPTYGMGFGKQYKRIEKEKGIRLKEEKRRYEEINEIWNAYGLNEDAKNQMGLLMNNGVEFGKLKSAVIELHGILCNYGSDIKITCAGIIGSNGDSTIKVSGFIDEGICLGHEETVKYPLNELNIKQHSLC